MSKFWPFYSWSWYVLEVIGQLQDHTHRAENNSQSSDNVWPKFSFFWPNLMSYLQPWAHISINCECCCLYSSFMPSCVDLDLLSTWNAGRNRLSVSPWIVWRVLWTGSGNWKELQCARQLARWRQLWRGLLISMWVSDITFCWLGYHKPMNRATTFWAGNGNLIQMARKRLCD